MKPSVVRKQHSGRKPLVGLLLTMVVISMPLTGIAQIRYGGGHGSDFSHGGGRHGFNRYHDGGNYGRGQAYAGAPYDSRIIYRGPLGFELHDRLRHGRALHRGEYAATPEYYPDCRTVYQETYLNGRPATVSGLLCYDENGSPYVIPESRRLVDYYQ